MLALSLAMLVRPTALTAPLSLLRGDTRLAAIVALVTLAYLALWGTGFFFLRTVLFLFLLLRLLGEKPKASFSASGLPLEVR